MGRNSIPNPEADVKCNPDLDLYYFGTQQCTPCQSWGPGVKDHYKLHYVHSGKGYLTVDGRTTAVNKGQLFACFPNHKVFYKADMNDPWCYSWVAFDGLNSKNYLKRANISREQLVIDCPEKEVVEAAYQNLLRISSTDSSKDMKYIGYLYLILSSIVMQSQYKGEASTTNAYIKNAVKYIQDHYTQDVSIAELSAALSLDRKYFSRIFKEELKLSPSEYVITYRLMKACELMEQTDLSIAEIAASVGYDNQFSFSRIFKKYKNMSPSEYKTECSSHFVSLQ